MTKQTNNSNPTTNNSVKHYRFSYNVLILGTSYKGYYKLKMYNLEF